jgi:glucose-1-phosphate thymidylyltransferase
MKGIILAGGSGTRLYPLTKTISKQLLPVYDKPMIYYPLSTLMLMGIRDILIISTPKDTPNIKELLGDGKQIGINLEYAIQDSPKGIAEAFIIGADFIDNDDVCLILGDNIFYMGGEFHNFRNIIAENKGNHVTIFAYHVPDPERFGVVQFDHRMKVLSIEEKPDKPKSNYASVGLYLYPNDVVQKAKTLQPSARNELEITDLNNLYLKEDKIRVYPMGRGYAWLDAGTPDSLIDASSFIQIIEKRQGLKISCIEEIAYRLGYIDKNGLQNILLYMKPSSYKTYLEKVISDVTLYPPPS